MTGTCRTPERQQPSPRLAAFRGMGAGYLLFQAFWLSVLRWPSAESLLLKWTILVVVFCLAAGGALNAHLMGFRSWREIAVCIVAAEVAGAMGFGLLLLLSAAFVFSGPLGVGWIVGWAMVGWASVGSLAASSYMPLWIRWLPCPLAVFGGLSLTLIVIEPAFTGDLDRSLCVETYAVTMYSVHPMLLSAGVACYYTSKRLRVRGSSLAAQTGNHAA